MSPSIWLMKEGLRRQANGLLSPPNDAIIWTETKSQIRASMISPAVFFKTLVVSLAGVWTHDLLLLSRTLFSQLLTKQHCLSELKAKVVAYFEVVSKMNKVHSNLNIASHKHLHLANQQKWQPVHGLYSYTFVAEAMYGNGCSMYIHVQCMV